MWWLFEKVSEAATQIIYRYSRESNECSGRIVFDKQTHDIVEFMHCAKDHSEFDKKVAIGKFICCVVDEGFPDKRKVVCG